MKWNSRIRKFGIKSESAREKEGINSYSNINDNGQKRQQNSFIYNNKSGNNARNGMLMPSLLLIFPFLHLSLTHRHTRYFIPYICRFPFAPTMSIQLCISGWPMCSVVWKLNLHSYAEGAEGAEVRQHTSERSRSRLCTFVCPFVEQSEKNTRQKTIT